MNKEEINKDLLDLFLNLIKIDATSGNELPVASFIKDYVSALGLEAHIDEASSLSGGNCGNVIVPINGGGDFLLMAHLDTPRPTIGVQPQLLEDRITSDGNTILGVDDRGGISAILWALGKAIKNGDQLKPCTLLFTISEETTLAGSLFFKPNTAITHGFVFDSHLSPGKFVSETCGAIAFKFTIEGIASHAGVAPEKGVNAIQIAAKGMSKFPFGRIDARSTANIGIINGGMATNVVPDLVELEGEIRTEQLPDGEEIMNQVISDFQHAADKCGGKIKCEWHWDFKPYKISPENLSYQKMRNLCSLLSLTIQGVKSMGGSDANSMNAKGIETINLGVGAQNPHGVDEFILYKDLQTSGDMAYTLLTKNLI